MTENEARQPRHGRFDRDFRGLTCSRLTVDGSRERLDDVADEARVVCRQDLEAILVHANALDVFAQLIKTRGALVQSKGGHEAGGHLFTGLLDVVSFVEDDDGVVQTKRRGSRGDDVAVWTEDDVRREFLVTRRRSTLSGVVGATA